MQQFYMKLPMAEYDRQIGKIPPSTYLTFGVAALVVTIVLNLSTVSNSGALVLSEVLDGRIQSLSIKIITDVINLVTYVYYSSETQIVLLYSRICQPPWVILKL